MTGKIEDFELGVRPEDLVISVLRFAASPVMVPIKTVFGTSVPADGWERCNAATERAGREGR